MTNIDTEPAQLPPPTPAADHHDRRWARSDDRVVLGVASGLGRALAIEPLVIRIAFVVLALFSGVGIVLYIAALLLLADSPSSPPPSTIRRVAGGGVAMLSSRWLFSGDARLPGAGWVVAIGLLGIAIALWRGRSPLEVRSAPPMPEVAAAAEGGSTTDRWETWTQRRDRPRPPRSALGLLTIGTATVVGALAWLVGNDNSRGSHAFGWATVVLGAGLLVGTFAGRARWLIFPALLTSVAAVAAAALSFAGASIDHRSGGRTEFIGAGSVVLPRYSTGLGDFDLELFDYPSDLSTAVDVGAGKLTVEVPEDARVQIDARVGLGSIDAFGSSRSGYRRSLSLDDNKTGARLIKLKLSVGVGSIEVRRGAFFGGPPGLPFVPTTIFTPITPAITPDIPVSKYFGDGTVLFEDGSIDFGDGRRIEANGSYQIPIVQQLSDGSVQLDNGAIVRADGTVVTPGGFVIPHRVQGVSTAPSTTVVPITVTSGVQP